MEIEAKILEVDAKAIGRRLKALGTRKTFDGTHEAFVFDDEQRSIHASHRLLRLRREVDRRGERVTFTFKRKVKTKSVKHAVEHETVVSSFDQARKILEGLGLRVTRVVRKRRKEYSLGRTHYCLDSVGNIPTYLEIEAPSQAGVIAAARKLGFTKDDLKPWTVGDVMKHYGVKPPST